MSEFILELGIEEAGTDSGKKEFRSRGFYNGYTVNGPIIVRERENAYAFPLYENAQRVQAGDERLHPSRIVPR